jgi:hypothetical protein
MTRKFRKGADVVEAVQITDATFDDDHPNPEHVIGVVYDPIERCALIERPVRHAPSATSSLKVLALRPMRMRMLRGNCQDAWHDQHRVDGGAADVTSDHAKRCH